MSRSKWYSAAFLWARDFCRLLGNICLVFILSRNIINEKPHSPSKRIHFSHDTGGESQICLLSPDLGPRHIGVCTRKFPRHVSRQEQRWSKNARCLRGFHIRISQQALPCGSNLPRPPGTVNGHQIYPQSHRNPLSHAASGF